MAGKKRRPVAICRKCGEHTGFFEHVRRRCYRMIDGRKCGGVFRSVDDPDEFEECPSCAAAGWTEGEKCGRCQGHGWLYVEHGLG